jgi:predicted nuclease with TOPRIM domain
MEEFRKTPRKKIWEISSLYHCSVAGTCLSLDETKKIFRKCGIVINSFIRDYEIHGAAVNALLEKSDISKSMHSFIEKKYSYFINIFNNAESEPELMQLWDNFLEQGNVAGAYWALMTHPSVSQRNLDRAFGDVHMLSHINGATNRAGIRELEDLRKSNALLLAANDQHKAEVARLKSRLKFMEEKTGIVNELTKKLEIARNEIKSLKEGSDHEKLKEENSRLRSDLVIFSDRIERLTASASAAELRVEELLTEKLLFQNEVSSKDEELHTMETTLLSMLKREKGTCSGCMMDEQNRIDLCGKCILYVGGKPSVISRCREMVEHYGGEFIHHDGGKEESLTRLPAILHRADAIFCPLDCVSHNACLSVKKMSQRHQKPFLLLKSSGLSSFLKGVNDISKNNFAIDGSVAVQN